MKQLILILISIIFGYLYAFFKNTKIIYLLIITILSTILYIFVLYILNDGIINLPLKLSLIIGYILNQKCQILLKKCKIEKSNK